MNNKTKAILIIALFLIVITAIVFLLIRSTKVPEKEVENSNILSHKIEETEIYIPNVTKDNITIYASTIELTSDPVIVQAIPRLTEYNLYCYVQELLTDEEKNQLANVESTSETGPNRTAVSIDLIDSILDSDFELYESALTIKRNSRIYFKYEKDGMFSESTFEIAIENIMKAEDVGTEKEETITEEELEKNKVDNTEKQKSTSKYFIRVNYGANTVTIYQKDDNGEYSIPVKAMVCSCGISTPTSGTYKTTDKYTWRALVGNVYGKYATRIVGSILFHSVPYTAIDNGALEWWEYDKLGTKASAGCVRLTVADAKWIYDNCSRGTLVEFYSDSNPGPLGKPTAQKISSNEECRNWDPTDYSAGNPWFNVDNDNTSDDSQNIQNSENTSNESSNNTVENTEDTTVTIIPGQSQEEQENNTNVNNNINTNTNNTNTSIQPENNVNTENIQNTNNTVENNTSDENTNTNTSTGVDIIIGGN